MLDFNFKFHHADFTLGFNIDIFQNLNPSYLNRLSGYTFTWKPVINILTEYTSFYQN